MPIGYACLTLGVPGTDLKSCILKNASEEKLLALIRHNLNALEKILDYNIQNDIQLFRISSDIIPFASSPANTLAWGQLFSAKFAELGLKIHESGMRVSMHPGQYTVLNALNSETVHRAIEDIQYHVLFLDSLGLGPEHKIILHLGGVYGDKRASKNRFSERYRQLDESAKRRIVIENDDKSYHIGDVLEVGSSLNIPVVFDNLHHHVNYIDSSKTDADWISACAETWTERDGIQKIHYSQQDPLKKAGSHSLSIRIDEFLEFYSGLDQEKPDIMLEVKDKNISAVKCILGTADRKKLGALEREWGRYKYLVLEHAPQIYNEIRALLRNKTEYPAVALFRLVESALTQKAEAGNSVNAAMHVWGYFKNIATEKEKRAFKKRLDGFSSGQASLGTVKNNLYKLADIYRQDYLLDSYYFVF